MKGTIGACTEKNSMCNQLSNGFDSRRLHQSRSCRTNKNNRLLIGGCSISVWICIDLCRHGHDLGTIFRASSEGESGLTCSASTRPCNSYMGTV